jgi:dipeptidyl aminopeptidase/acylaminoacyl peptidase
MERDVRNTDLYREVEVLCNILRRPGTGQISDACEVHTAPDGKCAVFAGALMDRLEGLPSTRICRVDLSSGDVRMLTFGPNTDRWPKYAPDGRRIAFLSDRHRLGDFQLFLLDVESGAAMAARHVPGWVEYLQWSPDGRRILLAVAGHGADVSGGQGAVTSEQSGKDSPSWMPIVATGDESYRWRRAWVYELAANLLYPVDAPNHNIWEAVWCGNDALAAVVSPGPGEGLWYTARLAVIEVNSGQVREIYSPKDQLGWPASSPSGRHVAIVDALCSDRWIVAGEPHLIETVSGAVKPIDVHGIDISHTEWRSDQTLLLAGHRGFETVVGRYDVASERFTEVWSSSEISTAGRYITVSGLNDAGDCVLVGESYVMAPEIAVIRHGAYAPVKSFDLGYLEIAKSIAAVEPVRWNAKDGLDIQGWLLRPHGKNPYPLILNVHGGPVWHLRPVWLGRSGLSLLMLIKRGYAVFFPNPRGSAGRGRDFVRKVYGDMGGADAQDLLAGIDALTERGIADPSRLGVIGGSYGGFMTSWLITQDTRFGAAVPFAPHTNQVTERLLSNIPHFMDLLLQDQYNNPGGKYFERSPVMHAHKVKTPTLNITGALDRCTPAEEAEQFHNALIENGVESVLVIYPEEGHGVRKFPSVIDYTTRVVNWFEEHLRSTQ